MNTPHPRIVAIVEKVAALARRGELPLMDGTGRVPVAHYTDPARLDRERERLFRGLPQPVAHVSELGGATNVLVRDVDGVSIVVVRDGTGGIDVADGSARLRAFRNACRHRSVRLVREDCRAKAFVCPYHGWTYGTDGALIHVPHAQAFPGCDAAASGLVPVNVEARHGIVWVTLAASAPDVATHLDAIDDELASLGLEKYVVGQRVVREQRGNWKTLIEAFLESYHLRTLHRNTIYPFFLDACSLAERAGPHVRAASARRKAKELADPTAVAETDIPSIATLNWIVFPATTLIAHPDWTSLITVQPRAVDRFVWSHTQLIPHAPATDEARAHYARSFALIEGEVFTKEDLLMCAETWEGLTTGANDSLLFGRLESPALWFHAAVETHLSDRGT